MDISAYIKNEKERPLDVIKPDGGFFGIFRTVACVGGQPCFRGISDG